MKQGFGQVQQGLLSDTYLEAHVSIFIFCDTECTTGNCQNMPVCCHETLFCLAYLISLSYLNFNSENCENEQNRG